MGRIGEPKREIHIPGATARRAWKNLPPVVAPAEPEAEPVPVGT